MLQKEFEVRTGLTTTQEEFDYIHDLYLNTTLDMDEFCKDFKLYGASNIIRSLHVTAVNYQLQCKDSQTKLVELADFLIGKACVYDDTDCYNQAIKLIGKKQVVIRKMEMNLPLWEEDKQFITLFLNTGRG